MKARIYGKVMPDTKRQNGGNRRPQEADRSNSRATNGKIGCGEWT